MSNEVQTTAPANTPRAPEPKRVPLLPLRDIVISPRLSVPLLVGRDRSVAAINAARSGNNEILLATQLSAAVLEPAQDDLNLIGTLGRITQLLKLPQNKLRVVVEGVVRARITNFRANDPCFIVDVETLPDITPLASEDIATARALVTSVEEYLSLSPNPSTELQQRLSDTPDALAYADLVLGHLPLTLTDKQRILATLIPGERLTDLLAVVQSEIEILKLEKRIRTRVKKQVEKNQKEYYLNERMQAIQKELGEQDEFKAELAELQERIEAKALSDEARNKLDREMRKLKMMSPMSAEATVLRNYLDWVLSLPWGDASDEKRDIPAAREVLETDHHGLEKIKDRILEYLAVCNLTESVRGPILCFVGPPGVGKTSLARSIARATGRKFVRVSLGGVHDEAEIRGHRRTYIGALPGKIIQSLKKVGTSNPVFLLDEIDKLSRDYRGDPASALLEVLDPEQNNAFSDHYIDLDYDLSRVMFIATANSLAGIPLPLRDRLEIIQLGGYTDHEKLAIAERYLVPKQRDANGLAAVPVTLTNDAIQTIIRRYTREAGVRSLEREIGTVFRKLARDLLETGDRSERLIDGDAVMRLLGVPKFKPDARREHHEVGMATGLAWTEVGGETLQIEINLMPGKGKLTITGKLGDVMQESAQAALSYVRSRAHVLGLSPNFYNNIDIHIHVPEGAIPKDGPSAGITMATALVSSLTGIPVRADIAMTGEITLRGRVLPIGGLKEKTLAAYRLGIHDIIAPEDNRKDLEDIPPAIREVVTFHFVAHMDDVLKLALTDEPAREAFPNVNELLRPPPTVAADGSTALTGPHGTAGEV